MTGGLAGLTKSDAVSATGLCQDLGQRTRRRTEHVEASRTGGVVERRPTPVGNTGAAMATASTPGIGTLRERPLHASLKRWYAEPGDRTEVAVDGYVIDLVRGDLLIEVQTRGLSSARHKVAALLGRGHRIRVISPIAVDSWIVKFDGEGSVLSRRRSPRHGIPSDIFAELVSIATLLDDPRLEIDPAHGPADGVLPAAGGRHRRRRETPPRRRVPSRSGRSRQPTEHVAPGLA